MKKLILSAFALAAVVAIPSVSLAATYAYVNSAGEVMTMDAASANQALTTAPNIHVHSGVMLIEMTSDDADLVGDSVPGT